MILEAYMQPRVQPVTESGSIPVTALIQPHVPQIAFDLPRPHAHPFEDCSTAGSQPLLVEEIELAPVSRARFEAVERDARHWADAHRGRSAPVSSAEDSLPEPETARLEDPAGPARFHCRDEAALPVLECCENEPDEAEIALFQVYLDRPPRFGTHGSQGARQASDERAWICEVAAGFSACVEIEAAPAPDTPAPRRLPEWALHLDEIEVTEHIDLRPVDLATLSRAA